MQTRIRILNPVSDCQFTDRNRAARFVRDKRAEWVRFGKSIRFLSSDSRHRSTAKVVDRTRLGYDQAAYASGKAKMCELANLPMVAPSVFLNVGKRKGATRQTFLSTQGF